MENLETDIVSLMRNYGWYVRTAYEEKGAVKKMDGVSYRLLNALKTSNASAFIDILIRCYMYVGKEIPKAFADCLKDDMLFKTMGYAFVIGLNGIDYKKDKEA